jgi:hypothetical protein
MDNAAKICGGGRNSDRKRNNYGKGNKVEKTQHLGHMHRYSVRGIAGTGCRYLPIIPLSSAILPKSKEKKEKMTAQPGSRSCDGETSVVAWPVDCA